MVDGEKWFTVAETKEAVEEILREYQGEIYEDYR